MYDFQTKTASLLALEQRSIKDQLEFIQTHTKPYTIVYTKQWKEVREKAAELGRHSGEEKRQYVDPTFSPLSQEASSYWAYATTKLSGVRPTEKRFLSEYLDEIMWRDRYAKNEKGDRDASVAPEHHSLHPKAISIAVATSPNFSAVCYRRVFSYVFVWA